MALTKPKLSQNIDTDISVFSDPILVLHQGSTQPDIDVGFLMNRSNGLTANAAVIWQESSRSFVHILTNSSGVTDSNLVVQSYANVSVGNVLLINNAGIYVDGTLGSAGQVLQSDGSKTYWGAAGGFSGGAVPNQTTFASNLVVSNTTPSTSNVTGALVVRGGVGIAGNVYANVFYTADGIRWAGNGAVFASGGGGGTGTTYTANTAPPTSGNVAGDMWYNTGTDILYEYLNDGTSNYWVDVQSLGQTGNITTISDATLAGNIVVSLNNTISIGGTTGYLRNIFANIVTANTQNTSGNITAGNVVTGIVSATGNITAANVTVSGNIRAAFVHGDGSKLTNLNAATTGKAIAMAIVFGG